MQTRFFRVFAFVAWLLLGSWAAALRADHQLCTKYGILIEGNDPEDVVDACTAVKGAESFFKLAGLPMPRNTHIRLVDESSSPFMDDHEIGHYNGQLHAIVIRDYRAARTLSKDMEPGVGAITSRAVWRSYIVHELTHAAIHSSCDQHCPSRAVHEYVAAVAQLSALPEQHRLEMFDIYRDLGAFEHESEITEIYYALNPHYFAVKSYKHYRQLSDPKAFLKELLNLR